MAFELLQETLGDICKVRQVGGSIELVGHFDGNNHRDFVCCLKHIAWFDVPPNTKIIIKDFMVEKLDTKFGGDIWGVKWFIEWFGPNVVFVDCVVVEYISGKFEWVGNFSVEWLDKNFPNLDYETMISK